MVESDARLSQLGLSWVPERTGRSARLASCYSITIPAVHFFQWSPCFPWQHGSSLTFRQPFFFFFFFFFFLYSEPKSPSHRVNKEQTGDGTGRTQPTSGLGILMCPAHQMKIYRRERERERERERA